MWAKRSHLLQPLTALTTKKVKFKWTIAKQKLFDKIKRIVARDTLLIHPDFNKKFDIHTDGSEFQLEAVIIQDGKSITFYIRKLTELQTWYTVTEKELLSIVETLKEFFTDLLVQQGREPGRQILYAHTRVRQPPHSFTLGKCTGSYTPPLVSVYTYTFPMLG